MSKGRESDRKWLVSGAVRTHNIYQLGSLYYMGIMLYSYKSNIKDHHNKYNNNETV